MRTIRIVENGTVLRLFTEERAAANYAAILAKGALQRYPAQLHGGGIGWLVMDTETGRRYDEAGLIETRIPEEAAFNLNLINLNSNF